jgi:hypothetical protein
VRYYADSVKHRAKTQIRKLATPASELLIRLDDGSQAALFVSLCRVVGASRPTRTIENGERLCEAFEIFREWEPTSDLEFEQVVLLMDGAAQGDHIDCLPCSSCAGYMLIDKFGDTRAVCHVCRRNLRQTKGTFREVPACAS